MHIGRRSDQTQELSKQGQTLTEFAMIMPLLIALLVAIILFAWVGFSYVSISSGAREGARWMVVHPTESDDPATYPDVNDEIRAHVLSAMPFVDPASVQITLSPPVAADRVPIIDVAVQITYPLSLPVIEIPYFFRPGKFVLLPPIVLSTKSSMRLFE